MKKQILFLTILLLIVSVSGCSKKESETKPETGADMPEKSSDCTFKAVVTEVNDAGMVVKPVPGSAELKSSDAIAIGKAAITDNSNPEIGDTYEIVYDGRILETYPAGLSNISRVVLVEKKEDNTNVSGTEHVISYNLGDLAEDFTETPEKAQSGNKVEIRTQVLYDAGIHLYLDGQELKISHYDSDYWGYSFVMPDKDVEITAEPYTYAEIWGTSDEKTTVPDDFSIKIHFGLSEYDSETGKLVKETQPFGFFGNTVEDYTTEYYLSEEQKAELFNMIMDMDFDSYPDVYNPCEGFYSDPSYTVILEVKHNSLEKKVRCYDIVSLDSAESYQKYHPDIWENISKEGKNFIILHGAIVDMLTSSAEWKALPDYDLWER